MDFTVEGECFDPADSAREDIRGIVMLANGKQAPCAPVEMKAKLSGWTTSDPTGMLSGSNAENHGKVCCIRACKKSTVGLQ